MNKESETTWDALPDDWEQKLTQQTFDEVANKPASLYEISATQLATKIIMHPKGELIIKRVLNHLITNSQIDTLESIVNEAVYNHGLVDTEETVLLDIKLKD